jgi:hypothetical protein
MRKLFTVLMVIGLGIFNNLNAQINTGKEPPVLKPDMYKAYDSTRNYLSNETYKYIGQELFLKPDMSGTTERFGGYSGFDTEYIYTGPGYKTYKPSGKLGKSSYEDLVGKYFSVLDVIEYLHPVSKRNIIYLQLKEKESGDIVYYTYKEFNENAWPFLIVGHFEKVKENELGKKFIVRKNGTNGLFIGGGMRMEDKDINSGEKIELIVGEILECIDVSYTEIRLQGWKFNLVFRNDKGNEFPIILENTNNKSYLFDYKLAQEYIEEFDEEIWDIILNNSVKLGMTSKECRVSYGIPDKVNSTRTEGMTSEQWVYKNSYLYFDNGILKAIQ